MENNFDAIDEHLTDKSDLYLLNNGFKSLQSIANWCLFFAILGLLSIFFMFLGGAGFTMIGESVSGMGTLRTFLIVFYLLFAVIYIAPVYYMLKFSLQMKRALRIKDNQLFNQALGKLSLHFLIMGVMTIIFIVLYIAIIIFTIVGGVNLL